MLSFLVGAGCIVAPQYGLPVAAVAGLIKAARRARLANAGQLPSSTADLEKAYETFSGPSQSVILQFDDLKCTLITKTGATKEILKGVTASAQVRFAPYMGPLIIGL